LLLREMKFTIEMLRHSSDKTVMLQRYFVHGISPKWAKVRGITLLAAWKKRGANAIAIRNGANEIIYEWREGDPKT
jgi:hypothetical protein